MNNYYLADGFVTNLVVWVRYIYPRWSTRFGSGLNITDASRPVLITNMWKKYSKQLHE